MAILNYTSLPNILHVNEDADGRLFNILIVKSSYHLDSSNRLTLDQEIEPLNFTDYCFEDFNSSSLKYPSDLVPFKPNTDFIVIADSYAPGGRAQQNWNCGVRVRGEKTIEKSLKVYGSRQWLPEWSTKPRSDRRNLGSRRGFRKWVLSETTPIDKLPIRYEHAFGGVIKKADLDGKNDQYDAYEANPLGKGLIDNEYTDHYSPVDAPQIELLGKPIVEPYHLYEPHSLGPIPPSWLPRRPLGGTLDEDWIENRWPHWPADYSFNYHNSAPRELQYPGHIRGDEKIDLLNLRPNDQHLEISLPGHRVFVENTGTDGVSQNFEMVLDTVYLDLTPAKNEDVLISLTWRYVFDGNKNRRLKIKSNFDNVGRTFERNYNDLGKSPSPLELT